MKETNRNNEIENLKKVIFSKEKRIGLAAADKLAKIGGDDGINFLIGLLELGNVAIRNRAALALREIEDNRALNPLLKAIFKPENKNYNGTLVYALETLDCKSKLVEIFQILFYHQYESKMGACTILEEQIFEFTSNELLEIKGMWEDCNKNPEKAEDFDKEEKKLAMQDVYDGFMIYLEE